VAAVEVGADDQLAHAAALGPGQPGLGGLAPAGLHLDEPAPPPTGRPPTPACDGGV
jgi:hypothetical protein